MHDRFFSGLRFHTAAKLVVQVISWAGTIYVLREVDSRALGLFGIVTAVYGYAAMVHEGGLLEAVVQRPPEDDARQKAVFSLLVFSGLGLAGLLAVAAPMVAALVGDPLVTPLTWLLAVALLLTPIGILPQALMMHEMRFGQLAIVASLQALATTLMTVVLAQDGGGAWALVAGMVAGVVVKVMALHLMRPALHPLTFRLGPARPYLGTGGVLIADGLLWRWYTSLDTLLLGRWSGTTALGQFSFAQQIANLPLERISTIVNDVSLPAYAGARHDQSETARMMLETLRTHAVIGFPIFWGIAAVAEPTIRVVFGDKWLPALFPLVALSLIAPLRLMGSIETPAMTGIGRPSALLRSKAIVVPGMTLSLALGAWLGGVNGVAWAWLLAFPLFYGLGFRQVLQTIGLPYRAVFAAMRGPALAAAAMLPTVYLLLSELLAGVAPAWQLAAGVATGATTYLVVLWLVDRRGLGVTVDRARRLAGFAPAGES